MRRNGSILVIDDEEIMREILEALLTREGYDVRLASSGEEGLELARTLPFDAAIVDVNLGGEKSYPVADALARLGIPFVFSTGYNDHGDRLDLEDRPVLRKPYTRAALIAVFERLLPDEPLPVAA